MKKNVWLINHYANHMLEDHGGRHYFIPKYLVDEGYDCTVFSSNVRHGKAGFFFDNKKLFNIQKANEINVNWIFVKGREYNNNGIKRVLNMVDFYFNCIKAGKRYAKTNGKPDIIYASSVHPLALLAGIRLAKYFKIKCVSEVRDLWPESIVAYSSRFTKNNALIKLLYKGEKWIYKKSDAVVMTWPGGYDYIVDQHWDNELKKEKFHHICNGVDNSSFNKMILSNSIEDNDLDNGNFIKFIYTGSIRKVNNLALILEADEILENNDFHEHKIIIYGSGDELEKLMAIAYEKKLKDIVFKGRIKKELVPYALSKGDFSILHNTSTILDIYGQSQNKLFEYFAVGHPILMTYKVGYSLITGRNCGVELESQTANNIAKSIMELCHLDKHTYESYSKNCLDVALEYDYKMLTNKLINIFEKL